jgi:hypothetical protein
MHLPAVGFQRQVDVVAGIGLADGHLAVFDA